VSLARFLSLLLVFSLWIAQGLNLSAQDSLAAASKIISLPGHVTDIETDAEGNLFMLSPSGAMVYKALKAFGYDSLAMVGGRSARQEGLLYPTKIAAKNRQNLYLLDEGQRRIALFNTNLRLSGEVRFTEIRGAASTDFSDFLPQSFDVGPAGELFLLNQIDNRILKINAFGEFETEFGGLDYGSGSLTAPVELVVNDKSYVFVSDTLEGRITVFDLFGIYRFTLTPACNWKRLALAGNQLMLFNSESIWQYDPASGALRAWTVPPDGGKIRDLAVGAEMLFVLRENGVFLHSSFRP
jgi:hypothetical protein